MTGRGSSAPHGKAGEPVALSPPVLPTVHPDHQQIPDRTWIHTGSTVGPGEVRFSQFPVLL